MPKSSGVPCVQPARKSSDFIVTLQTNDDGEQMITMKPLSEEPSPEKYAFWDAISTTETVIKSIFQENKEQGDETKNNQYKSMEYYMRSLTMVAKLGLEGNIPIEIAKNSLRNLQSYIMYREAPRIKNNYMIRLGATSAALILTLLLFISATYTEYYTTLWDTAEQQRNFLIVWVGAMVGTWLSFGIRNVTIEFENLGKMESDLMEPPVRLFFTGILAIAFALILDQKIVQFELGELKTSSIANNAKVAFLVGLFCGIAEKTLPNNIGGKANQFLAKSDTARPNDAGQA